MTVIAPLRHDVCLLAAEGSDRRSGGARASCRRRVPVVCDPGRTPTIMADLAARTLPHGHSRTSARHCGNIVATQGDAQTLPYSDHAFDAAYVIGVLGEIPDAAAGLRELRRVLKPGSRLVVSGLFIDPNLISRSSLRGIVGDASFGFKRSAGPSFAHTALFRPAATSS